MTRIAEACFKTRTEEGKIVFLAPLMIKISQYLSACVSINLATLALNKLSCTLAQLADITTSPLESHTDSPYRVGFEQPPVDVRESCGLTSAQWLSELHVLRLKMENRNELVLIFSYYFAKDSLYRHDLFILKVKFSESRAII